MLPRDPSDHPANISASTASGASDVPDTTSLTRSGLQSAAVTCRMCSSNSGNRFGSGRTVSPSARSPSHCTAKLSAKHVDGWYTREGVLEWVESAADYLPQS